MTDFTVWIDAEEMSGQSLPLWASILIIGIALTGAVLVVVPWFTGGRSRIVRTPGPHRYYPASSA